MTERHLDEVRAPGRGCVGLATFGSVVVAGLGGAILGLLAMLDNGNLVAAALFWVASALGFGLGLNALLRQ